MPRPARYLPLLLIGLLLAAAPRAAAEGLSPGAIKARDFGYKSVRLGSNFADFQAEFPDATITASKLGPDSKRGVVVVSPTRFVVFEFFRDRVYAVKVGVHNDELDPRGGAQSLLNNLTKTYGPTDDSFDDGETEWYFDGVEIDVVFSTKAYPSHALLAVTEMETVGQVLAEMAQRELAP